MSLNGIDEGSRLDSGDITKIAKELRRLQTENSQSLTQIAENADVAPSTVASLANPGGTRGSNPRASTLKKIKDAYPTFLVDDEHVETTITGHCFYGKINAPRALEPTSVRLRRSGMMDFSNMGIVIVKATTASRAQTVFDNAYFFHPLSPSDAVEPDSAIGKFAVVYERQDDEVAAGAVWLGVLERRPGSEDYVMVSCVGDGVRPNTKEEPLIIAPKAARGLNIEYVMPIYGVWFQAQMDAFRVREAARTPGARR
jgi:transcriptional regulator with XRE-family HTH domain